MMKWHIGFDNVPFSDVMQVPLTTISVPVEEMGKFMGEKVIEMLDDRELYQKREKACYLPKLLVRASTRSISV